MITYRSIIINNKLYHRFLPFIIIINILLRTSADNDPSIIPTETLYNGITIPLVGIGCASGVRKEHVKTALSIGYTFLDTAQSYNWGYHEDEVGIAVKEFLKAQASNSSSSNIFVQTKIHPEDLGYEATKRAIQKSLQRLNVQQLDSVLIHKPHCWDGACSKKPEGTWQDSWLALQELFDSKIITKSIGICDVNSESLLNELLAQRIKPHIIQNYFDPLHQDVYMRKKIQNSGILYQGYSTLGTQWKYRNYDTNPVMNNPLLQQIAQAHSAENADIAQVIINWATTRHRVSVLPASTNPIRQEGNLYNSFRFTLSEEELQMIDDLDGKIPAQVGKRETNEVTVQFENPLEYNNEVGTLDVYWIQHDKKEIRVGSIPVGKSLILNSFHGHTFRFYGNEEKLNQEHTIDEDEGEHQIHVIKMEEEDEEL